MAFIIMAKVAHFVFTTLHSMDHNFYTWPPECWCCALFTFFRNWKLYNFFLTQPVYTYNIGVGVDCWWSLLFQHLIELPRLCWGSKDVHIPPALTYIANMQFKDIMWKHFFYLKKKKKKKKSLILHQILHHVELIVKLSSSQNQEQKHKHFPIVV